MPGKKPMDWSAVDWSQQNRDIAEQFRISPCSVSVMRKLLRKPKPKHWRRPKNFAARLQQWSKVDWRETNAVIGQKIGVSLQWVHRVRRALGMPDATIRRHNPRATRCLERAKAGLDQVRGCSVAQAAAILGIQLGTSSRARRFLDEQAVLHVGRREAHWESWHLMNFDLGNTTLAHIWGLSRLNIAGRRFQHKLGPARWDGNTHRFNSCKPQCPRFRRAVVEEQVKAWKLSLDRRKLTASPQTRAMPVARGLPARSTRSENPRPLSNGSTQASTSRTG
jgi:hypothetical protein